MEIDFKSEDSDLLYINMRDSQTNDGSLFYRGCCASQTILEEGKRKESFSCSKLDAQNWLLPMDLSGLNENFNCAEVRFKNSHKDFYTVPSDINIQSGDIVAVEASPGHDIGVVSLTGELVLEQIKKYNVPPKTEFKKIYRKAKTVDFEKDFLSEKLLAAGFQTNKKTLFAWLGVVPYLTEESILGTLKDISKITVTGSELIFDTLYRSAFTKGKGTMTGKKLFRSTRKKGEPMISGHDPEDLKKLLPEAGFELTGVVSPEDFTRMWFNGRKDALKPWKYSYVVRARVK